MLYIHCALKEKGGQSLLEALVGIAIGAIILVGTVGITVFALKASKDAERIETASALGKELLDKVLVLGESQWYALASLSTSSASHYYLTTSTSPFSVISGDENVVVGSSTYQRYFTLGEVGRDLSGAIVASGGTNDPSTRKVTVMYKFGNSPLRSMVTYITRYRHKIAIQTDWFGGPGEEGPGTKFSSSFSSSTPKINYVSSTGSIQLNL